MMNIFDLSAGIAGTKMLTERAHSDGSPIRRSKPDIEKAANPSGTNIASDLKQNSSSKKSGGTPVKILIAQEMLKETESKRKPPSVVARLMGLDDDLTSQPSLAASQGKLLEGYPKITSARAQSGRHQQEDGFFSEAIPYGLHRNEHEKMKHKDAHEVWQQLSQSRWGRCEENHNDLRMALVLQKFVEAKHLATDEKLLHSKEFQEALEVLSSNRDLFLKFLEEPNSLFAEQMNDLHSIPPPPQTKHITILKPSIKIETKFGKMMKKQEYSEVDESGWDTNNRHWNCKFNHLTAESFSQTTRIVVLKPSTKKPTKVSIPTMSAEHLVQSELHGDIGDSEAFRSRYIAKEVAQQMRKSQTGHRRDESLISSMNSNGYGGDASSFNRSETCYNEEHGGCFSDSEIGTPTSRHSWDRFGSTYSASYFSRVSCSPESSVIREAKKRLSERWALVASNRVSQEQMHLPRSSSTLGEMLAIPEVKRGECINRLTVSSSKSCDREDELRLPAFCLPVGRIKDGGELSPRNLSRSKSVPVPSSIYENSDSQISKSAMSEVSKTKHMKLSFGGKFSSFFFSRSKKTNKEIPVSSTLVVSGGKVQFGGVDVVVSRTDEILKSVQSSLSVDSQVKDDENSASAVSSISATNVPEKATPSLEKPRTCENSSEKEKLGPYQNFNTSLDQPSPTSILDAPFEDDVKENLCQLSEANAGQQSLSRASHIESVTRCLSWDDTHLEMSFPKPSNLDTALSEAEDADQECFVFVQKLLSYAGIEKPDMIFTGWYSLDSPLDPMLLDKFLDRKEEEVKCTVKRSNLRLLFDCVNSALLEAGRTTLRSVCPLNRTSGRAQTNGMVTSESDEWDVWGLVRYWFSGNGMVTSESDESSLVVDRALRREVGGNSCAESISIEVEEITEEIGREVLKDLVREALSDLAVACLC